MRERDKPPHLEERKETRAGPEGEPQVYAAPKDRSGWTLNTILEES